MCSAVEQGDSIIMGKGSVFLCRAHFVSTIERKVFPLGMLPFLLVVAASGLACGAESGLNFSFHTSALPDAFV